MTQILLHLPHTSTRLPKAYTEKPFLLPMTEIEAFNRTITDLFTEELFPTEAYPAIVFPWSRIYCDVEKYASEEEEPMSRWGMGMLYTHTNEGRRFFSPTAADREELLTQVYEPYHAQLRETVNQMLRKGDTLLLDCHSYCDEILMDGTGGDLTPDICIGINDGPSASKELTELVVQYFEKQGYTVSINRPYSGAMLPSGVELGEHRLFALMIEVHRRLYLRGTEKNQRFVLLQRQLRQLIDPIHRL